ncbi:hypothetical protein BH09PSE2_BH09PSE2_20730 [soil metagenome]
MGEGLRVVLALMLAAVVTTIGASASGWWLEPRRRVIRALRRSLGAREDAAAVSPERRQGLATSAANQAVCVIRFAGDPGLVRPLATVHGAELILDGEVKARAFRGEARRPLDRILAPEGGRVSLRVVFDDFADPAFQIDLFRPGDRPRQLFGAAEAVEDARAVYGRLEAAIQAPR